jgi:transcriptional regulator GlxA family with amidase domain
MGSHLHRISEWDVLARQAHFNVHELAALCRVSTRQLERFFLLSFARSPSEWMRELRMKQAGALLASGRAPKEVAYELGFKSISHFYREFKRIYQVTPVNYALSAWEASIALSQKGNDVALRQAMSRLDNAPRLQARAKIVL